MRNMFEDDDYDDELPSYGTSLVDRLLEKSKTYELPSYEPMELPELPSYEPMELPGRDLDLLEMKNKQYDDWKTNEFRLTGKHPDFPDFDIETPFDLRYTYKPGDCAALNSFFEAVEKAKESP